MKVHCPGLSMCLDVYVYLWLVYNFCSALSGVCGQVLVVKLSLPQVAES